MASSIRPPIIALAVACATAIALRVPQFLLPSFDPGWAGVSLPLLFGFGTFAGLKAKAGNRKLAVADAPVRARALAFQLETGCGWIVFIRRQRRGKQVGFDIAVDDALVAQLMVGQFTMISARAGRHRVSADISTAPGKSTIAATEVEMADGAVLFFETGIVKTMFRDSVRLDPVDDTPALRAELSRMPLVLA